MNYRLNHRQGNELAELYRRLADLERQVQQIPSRPARMRPAALEFDIEQSAHGFDVGSIIHHNGTAWVGSLADEPEMYMDWGHTDLFEVIRGEGECAAGEVPLQRVPTAPIDLGR